VKDITETDYRERIGRVTDAITADPRRAHTLETLARVAHFSRFHFHRVYRAMIGETVVETARRARLARAAHLLATSDLPVAEIASATGYESAQAFSRAFGNFARLSPSSFRQKKIRFADLVKGPRPTGLGRAELSIEVVDLPRLRAIVLLHQGSVNRIKETFSRLWQWQREHGIAGRTKEAIGICYGDPHRDDDAFRYYAGILWKDSVELGGGVEIHDVPDGKYARHRLIGSHDRIPAIFDRMYGEWLPGSGFLPDDRPALEIYRNNPFNTSENELITDLLLPIH